MLKFLIPAIVIAVGIAGALLFLPEPEIADLKEPPQPREQADSDGRASSASASDPQKQPRREKPNTNADDGSEPAAKTAAALEAPKVVPTFDVVRVTRDGNAVIAGRAEPGATVTVLDQGVPLGTVTADPNGEWVLIPQRQLDAGARELSIEAQGDGNAAVDSEQVVVLAVPDREGGGVVSGPPLAVLMPRVGEGASRVLQGPGNVTPEGRPAGGVSVDAVDYDGKGNVVISGRGVPDTEVRAYANGRLVGVSRTDTGGNWVLLPEESLRPGDYELRIDQVRTGGEVVARAATPFTRVEPARILVREGQVIVQPGNSLWRIARATYGSGPRFTVIYDANKDQIRDPDVIFPGQVFAVPPTN
ncbi:MAG: Ig-like domain-containing protein [Alphaproteobacteria bacterium]|nr:Ig-like domain-containing protein [Alphaproteobacteria bacterium]